ncbi:MAG: choice-of-anchor V domain-containing protein [Brumimicrobium sp.]|nr:choice-of-anchor V domain-containing protein [Brumimicrobium sp.]
MKNKFEYFLFAVLIVLASSAFISKEGRQGKVSAFHGMNKLNTSGSPAARTGAPGESNCTSCHSGSVQDGNNGINSLILTSGGNEYLPGQTNEMILTLNNSAAKNGFQLVAINTSEEMAGAFVITDNTNTQMVSSAFLNRLYVTHKAAGTTTNSWTFDWEAPAEGGDVTFYVATNKTNSSNSSSGDVIFLSQHIFTAPDLTGTKEEVKESIPLNLYFDRKNNALNIHFELSESGLIAFNVVGLDGKSVYFEENKVYASGNNQTALNLPQDIKNGVYILTMFLDNKAVSKKFKI